MDRRQAPRRCLYCTQVSKGGQGMDVHVRVKHPEHYEQWKKLAGAKRSRAVYNTKAVKKALAAPKPNRHVTEQPYSVLERTRVMLQDRLAEIERELQDFTNLNLERTQIQNALASLPKQQEETKEDQQQPEPIFPFGPEVLEQ